MRRISPIWAVLLLVLSSGCAHYRLGVGGRLSFHTLYVAPVQNGARLPQAVAVVTSRIREAFLRDGRVALTASPDTADATLTVTLDTYTRDVASARPDDTGLGRKFNLNLAAACTLRDNRTGSVLFENRPIAVVQPIFATATPQQLDSQQLQAEYQALPQLADKLADQAVHAALDVW